MDPEETDGGLEPLTLLPTFLSVSRTLSSSSFRYGQEVS